MDKLLTEQLILSTFLFKDVDEFLVEQIMSDPRCSLIVYEKNDIIYEKQHFKRSLGIILSGKIRAEKESGYFLSTLEKGEYFGAAAMFNAGEEYINRLIAITKCQVFFIPQEVLQWLMRRDYRIAEQYITYLSKRILFLNQKLDVLSACPGEKRLAMYLIRNGDVSCSMTELSGQLNLGRASLYRAIEALEREGLICQNQKQIKILDPIGLNNICKETL